MYRIAGIVHYLRQRNCWVRKNPNAISEWISTNGFAKMLQIVQKRVRTLFLFLS